MDIEKKLSLLEADIKQAKKTSNKLDPDYGADVVKEARELIHALRVLFWEIRKELSGLKWYEVWRFIPILKTIKSIVEAVK